MPIPRTSPGTTDITPIVEQDSSLEEAGERGICPWCQSTINPPTRGRPRVWCSDQCRRDAHNARKAARAGVVGMQVIRQTETVAPPPPSVQPTERPGAASETFDPVEALLHVTHSPELIARVLRVVTANLGPRSIDRQLPGPMHDAAVELAPLLADYIRRCSAPAAEMTPETGAAAALSRQQRRALQRSTGKSRH